jgi:LmbE family N-acetylglucosaminyl deacetylase
MKPIFGIFAHPDDEAMGPAGTLALLTQTRVVYLICVTSNDVRKKELQKSAEILGIRQVFFLDFIDGDLSNNQYLPLAQQIKGILDKERPDTIITYEPRGVSGHIDHITVSMVCSYLFERLSYLKKIMFYCRKAGILRPINYFIYFPPDYRESEIDESFDIKSVFSKKIAAIKCHQSQSHDVLKVLAMLHLSPKKEFFLVRTK